MAESVCNMSLIPRSSTSEGIISLEQTLQKIGYALNGFVDSSDQGDVPSWKYPHSEFKSLDVDKILRKLRGLKISEEGHYIQLAELCIDRMYYSLLTSLTHLKHICNKFYGDQKSMVKEHGHLQMTQAQDGTQDSRYVTFFPFDDTETRPNRMASVIQQLTAYFPLLEGSFLVFGGHQNQEKKIGRMTHASIPSRVCCLVKADDQYKCDFTCQAEIISIGCCKSCNDIANVVMSVGDALENCMKGISHEPSRTICIQEMSRELTQWEIVTNSCNNIRINCNGIVQNVTTNLEKNILLEIDIEKVKRQVDGHSSKNNAVQQRSQRKLFDLSKNLERETNEKMQLQRELEASEMRYRELKQSMEMHQKELKKCVDAKRALEETKKNLHKLIIQSTQEITDKKTELALKEKENGELHLAIHNAQELHSVEEEDLSQKSKSMGDALDKLKNRNELLVEEIAQAKQKLRGLKQRKKQDDKFQVRGAEHLVFLQNSLLNTRRELELLRMYPDLNGPVFKHSSGGGVMEPTIEQQMIANEERIALLSVQNKKLHGTLNRLKAYVNQNSTNTN